MSIYDVTVIGAGRLGGALALALSKNGYKISQLIVRNPENATRVADIIEPSPNILTLDNFDGILSDIIFITTQDSEIEAVTEKLAEKLEQMPLVFHTSGALSSDILTPLRKVGCEVASFHPLVSVSDSLIGSKSFADSYFCLEGDQQAVYIGKKIVDTLGGKSFSIKTKSKPLYHAAAVMSCGHIVALVSMAIEMFGKCGVSKTEAKEILFPLINSTLSNLSSQEPAKALTGTFARADISSLKLHLESLRENTSKEIFLTYLQLGIHSLSLAKQNGTDEKLLKEMQQIISDNLA